MRKEMLELADLTNGSMHWGGSFSSAEILAVLYNSILNCKDKGLSETEKDKFLLSKGHAAMALYTAMHIVGLLSNEKLKEYQADGSCISELIEYNEELGFDTSGGSLGINLSYAVGMGLLAKRRGYSYRVYIEVGDGEIDEGSVWEAVMSASQFGLDNVTMIIDANRLQSDGSTEKIISWNALEARLSSFGWAVYSVDGHDCEALLNAFKSKDNAGKPKAVIANTIKGKGVSFFENISEWHDRVLKGAELQQAKEEVARLAGNEH